MAPQVAFFSLGLQKLQELALLAWLEVCVPFINRCRFALGFSGAGRCRLAVKPAPAVKPDFFDNPCDASNAAVKPALAAKTGSGGQAC